MAGVRCELCDVAAGMACKDCHFYRHYESTYRISGRFNVVLFRLTPKGKFHMCVPEFDHDVLAVGSYAACGRRRRG